MIPPPSSVGLAMATSPSPGASPPSHHHQHRISHTFFHINGALINVREDSQGLICLGMRTSSSSPSRGRESAVASSMHGIFSSRFMIT